MDSPHFRWGLSQILDVVWGFCTSPDWQQNLWRVWHLRFQFSTYERIYKNPPTPKINALAQLAENTEWYITGPAKRNLNIELETKEKFSLSGRVLIINPSNHMHGSKGWVRSSLIESNMTSPGTIILRWWVTPELNNSRDECHQQWDKPRQHVTYHVSTDGLSHHAPNRSFGTCCCWDGWRGWWDEDLRDGGLWRRRSWSRRRGDVDGSWDRWRHGRRGFGPAHRGGRFGLWSWYHFADDSVGAKMRIVRVDGKESSDRSLTRYKENTAQIIHITFEPSVWTQHKNPTPLSHYKARTAWATPELTAI